MISQQTPAEVVAAVMVAVMVSRAAVVKEKGGGATVGRRRSGESLPHGEQEKGRRVSLASRCPSEVQRFTFFVRLTTGGGLWHHLRR